MSLGTTSEPRLWAFYLSFRSLRLPNDSLLDFNPFWLIFIEHLLRERHGC